MLYHISTFCTFSTGEEMALEEEFEGSLIWTARIMEEFELKGSFKDHIIPATLPQAATPSTGPDCSKLDLEPFQWWVIHHFSGQPFPRSYQTHCKIFLPYGWSKSTLFQFRNASSTKALSIFLAKSKWVLCSRCDLKHRRKSAPSGWTETFVLR